MPDYLKTFHKRLCAHTKECRDDFHEPDEQGIKAIVTGTHIDNAMGDDPYTNCCEYTVGIIKQTRGGETTEWFNLATLIALARKARI